MLEPAPVTAINNIGREFEVAHGFESRIVDCVLPVSGGRGFRLAWFRHGVEYPGGFAAYLEQRRTAHSQSQSGQNPPSA